MDDLDLPLDLSPDFDDSSFDLVRPTVFFHYQNIVAENDSIYDEKFSIEFTNGSEKNCTIAPCSNEAPVLKECYIKLIRLENEPHLSKYCCNSNLRRRPKYRSKSLTALKTNKRRKSKSPFIDPKLQLSCNVVLLKIPLPNPTPEIPSSSSSSLSSCQRRKSVNAVISTEKSIIDNRLNFSLDDRQSDLITSSRDISDKLNFLALFDIVEKRIFQNDNNDKKHLHQKRNWHSARVKTLAMKYKRLFGQRLKRNKFSTKNFLDDSVETSMTKNIDFLEDVQKNLRFVGLASLIQKYDEQKEKQFTTKNPVLEKIGCKVNRRKSWPQNKASDLDKEKCKVAAVQNFLTLQNDQQKNFCFLCGIIDRTVRVPSFFDKISYPDQSVWLFLCEKCTKPFFMWSSEPWKWACYNCLEKGSLNHYPYSKEKCDKCCFWECVDFVRTHMVLNCNDYGSYISYCNADLEERDNSFSLIGNNALSKMPSLLPYSASSNKSPLTVPLSLSESTSDQRCDSLLTAATVLRPVGASRDEKKSIPLDKPPVLSSREVRYVSRRSPNVSPTKPCSQRNLEILRLSALPNKEKNLIVEEYESKLIRSEAIVTNALSEQTKVWPSPLPDENECMIIQTSKTMEISGAKKNEPIILKIKLPQSDKIYPGGDYCIMNNQKNVSC